MSLGMSGKALVPLRLLTCAGLETAGGHRGDTLWARGWVGAGPGIQPYGDSTQPQGALSRGLPSGRTRCSLEARLGLRQEISPERQAGCRIGKREARRLWLPPVQPSPVPREPWAQITLLTASVSGLSHEARELGL